MGYLGRRIGLSQDKGDSTPGGADGAVGGGILDLIAHGYFQRQGNIHNASGLAPLGLSATGGVISDYTDGGKIYRAHIFTSSGTLNITAPGSFDSDGVQYLVVGGGGGGGAGSPPSAVGGSGGGAGGLRTNLSGHPLNGGTYPIPSSFPAPYTVTVGGGGFGRNSGANLAAGDGTSSEFYPPSHNSYPATQFIRGAGGGGGASRDPGQGPAQHGRPGLAGGGSGGGSWDPAQAEPGAAGSTDPNHPQVAGYAGAGSYPPSEGGGGGGGAGGAGSSDNPSSPNSGGGAGGVGIRVSIGGPSSDPSPIGEPGPGSGASATGWFAGGGGGGGSNTSADGGGGGGHPTKLNSYAGGGFGGGAPPSPTPDGQAGSAGSGGGGGGGGRASDGRNGGSGIVVIRYQIGTVQSPGASPKGATGGAVTIYNSKVIHTFTTSGTFTAPGSFSETLEYVIVGGGGAGGGQNFRGGGGGAGAVRHGTTPISGPSTTTVQVGAGGMYHAPEGPSGNGTSSYFGTPITSPGGGMGGGYESPYAGIPGGSGGGAGGYPGGSDGAAGTDPGPATGDSYPGDPADTSPANGWGYRGGGRGSEGAQQGGGGGGAGGAGIPSDSGDYPSTYGYGGPGVQLPTTFRDPRSAPGGTGGTGPHGPGAGGGLGYQNPGGTSWYVAGGGNGGGYSKPSGVNPSVITFVPAGGGGRGAINGPGNSPEPEHVYRNQGWPGAVNSGSGGGGASPAYDQAPGQGGSGLVLIAYPE